MPLEFQVDLHELARLAGLAVPNKVMYNVPSLPKAIAAGFAQEKSRADGQRDRGAGVDDLLDHVWRLLFGKRA